MSDITWTNITVKLGDLKPWELNPRQSSKAQAQRILRSFERFGQVEIIAVGPNFEVYDGHQRLSALRTLHGENFEVDARQSSRPLTEQERRELVVSLHAGAVGSWDWDKVSGWSAPELMEWGMNDETLNAWGKDYSNLKDMLQSEQPVPEFKEYDEDVEKDVEYLTCPHCGKTFPK
jgi:hypothetical protein